MTDHLSELSDQFSDAAESLGSGMLHVTGIGTRLAKREADRATDRRRSTTRCTPTSTASSTNAARKQSPGLDLAAVTAVDPQFTADEFLLIARDTFRILQDAHTDGAPALDADIASAEVTAASVVGGREQAVVRFGINGEHPGHPGLDLRTRPIGRYQRRRRAA